MSKNFADFEYKRATDETASANKTDKKKVTDAEQIQQTYDQLKNLDASSLQARLAEEVAQQKANGTFNYSLLQSSLESMKAFLPPENYENLKRLLESIK